MLRKSTTPSQSREETKVEKMTSEEKLSELLEITGAIIDSLLHVVPPNHKDYLRSLRDRVEELANEG